MDRERAWKVLLIEDDDDSAEAVVALLGLYGIETLWAADGPSALMALDSIRRLGESPPDFVLLDVNLPNTDTIALGHELRSHQIAAPIVLVSASSPDILESAAREIGAVASLRKPFSGDSLVAILLQYGPVDGAVPLNLRAAAPR